MLNACKLRVNRQRLGSQPRDAVFEGDAPVFSWALDSENPKAIQTACRLTLTSAAGSLWDTGKVITERSELVYTGKRIPADESLSLTLQLWDETNQPGSVVTQALYRGDIDWNAPWIAASEDEETSTVYFHRTFEFSSEPVWAALYVCGIGYHKVTVNGAAADDAELDPAWTDWTKRVQYAVIPEIQHRFRQGTNRLDIALGEGWRRNNGGWLSDYGFPIPDFFGQPQLTCRLFVRLEDGSEFILTTDENWLWSRGPQRSNHLFNGTVYDASETVTEDTLFKSVVTVPAPEGRMEPMLIPPIRAKEAYKPVALWHPEDGITVIDFGQNISGVIRLKLGHMKAGQRITVRHMEILDEQGRLYMADLRSAKAEDIYIASGDSRDLDVWQPFFTYHGFRYIEVEGIKVQENDIEAVLLSTELEKASDFRCGSALLNAFHHNALMTERDNMHSILTDCPQRDERMGWLNDATVRFEMTPFNFDTGAMFRKIVRDIHGSQREDGAIACTSPQVFGSRPADPVCSSYLIAAWQNWLHNGDIETIRENFDGFAAWEKCLLAHSIDRIVQYSYYGDWAGPSYACAAEEDARSAVTPGIFMSTGFSFMNASLLAEFAHILGRKEEALYWKTEAEAIRTAILDKWYDPQTCMMATGSEGCQAFALRLGLIPEEDRQKAAEILRNDLVARDFHFTTGNLCTRYLLDALTEYGYVNEAYALMTKEDYPSFGYQIQQEATTIWERFEMKKNPGMNSYNHPMYGASDAWLYTGLAGIQPLEDGFRRMQIRPHFPDALQSLQASVDTVRGRLTVRWLKRYGSLHLYIDLPPQTTAELNFIGNTYTLGPGTHHFSNPLADTEKT